MAAQIIPLPGARPAPVENVKRRGGIWPRGVISIRIEANKRGYAKLRLQSELSDLRAAAIGASGKDPAFSRFMTKLQSMTPDQEPEGSYSYADLQRDASEMRGWQAVVTKFMEEAEKYRRTDLRMASDMEAAASKYQVLVTNLIRQFNKNVDRI